MAVYVTLSDPEMKNLTALYSALGPYEGHEGIAAGSINTMYRVVCGGGTFYLRITQDRALNDLVYEKDVLVHLASRRARLSFDVPRLVRADSRGFFMPMGDRHTAMFFEELPGRELAVFELRPRQVAAMGQALAEAHDALDTFPARRDNPYGRSIVSAWCTELTTSAWAGAHPEPAAALAAGLSSLRPRDAALRKTVVHGDAFINNTKWQRGELTSLFDWEMAGDDVALVDLAVGLSAWCYDRTAGAFQPDLVAALVQGYHQARPLSAVEQAGLWDEARLAALRFSISRVRDFELQEEVAGPRQYLDYRDYLARYDALTTWGEDAFNEVIGT